MHHTRLLQQSVKLFTRPQCGLCSKAKIEIEHAAKSTFFNYAEVDITQPANQAWYDKYAFDVPVIHIAEDENSTPREILMHRVKSEQLVSSISALRNTRTE